jgi:hypothetical protein
VQHKVAARQLSVMKTLYLLSFYFQLMMKCSFCVFSKQIVFLFEWKFTSQLREAFCSKQRDASIMPVGDLKEEKKLD